MPLMPTTIADRWARYVPDPAAVKVSQITVAFRVIKVLTTGTGEAASVARRSGVGGRYERRRPAA